MLQRRVIAATAGTDARKTLVGTSAVPGDAGYCGLILPPTATDGQDSRYSVRLATVAVPPAHICRVLDIGQLLTIAACWTPDPSQLEREPEFPPPQDGGETADPPCFHLERPVQTPWWAFPDGNVSWHLRRFTPIDQSDMPRALDVDGYSAGLNGTGAAILFDQTAPPPIIAYVPPGRGALPGTPVGDLGVWHDMRFPWDGTSPSAQVPEIVVKGPCVLGMFASVHQTNPQTRLRPAPWFDDAQLRALVPEDQFLIAYPNTTRYYRIGGRMTVEICPDCEE